MLGERDTARYINMSPSWLRQQRMRRTGPSWVQIGRTVRYCLADLDAWLDRHRVRTEGGESHGRR
jgi:predicted DNA-binding transcriptional regulator AlpA